MDSDSKRVAATNSASLFVENLRGLITKSTEAITASDPISIEEGKTTRELIEMTLFVGLLIEKKASIKDFMIAFNTLYMNNEELFKRLSRNSPGSLVGNLPIDAVASVVKGTNEFIFPAGKINRIAQTYLPDVTSRMTFSIYLMKCMFYSTVNEEQRRCVGLVINFYEQQLGYPELTEIPPPSKSDEFHSGITSVMKGMGMDFNIDEEMLETIMGSVSSIKDVVFDESGSFNTDKFIGKDGSVDFDSIVTPLTANLDPDAARTIKETVGPAISRMGKIANAN